MTIVFPPRAIKMTSQIAARRTFDSNMSVQGLNASFPGRQVTVSLVRV